MFVFISTFCFVFRHVIISPCPPRTPGPPATFLVLPKYIRCSNHPFLDALVTQAYKIGRFKITDIYFSVVFLFCVGSVKRRHVGNIRSSWWGWEGGRLTKKLHVRCGLLLICHSFLSLRSRVQISRKATSKTKNVSRMGLSVKTISMTVVLVCVIQNHETLGF